MYVNLASIVLTLADWSIELVSYYEVASLPGKGVVPDILWVEVLCQNWHELRDALMHMHETGLNII